MKHLESLINLTPILAVFLLMSCESLVDDIPLNKLPKEKSKLVVHSIISPQLESINIVVTESAPIFSDSWNSRQIVQDAIVELSDGDNSVAIPYNPTVNLYSLPQSKFPISESKTYFLKVTQGGRSVTSQCKIPKNAPKIISYEFDSLQSVFEDFIDSSVTLRMNWKDIIDDTNYYHVNALLKIEHNADEKYRLTTSFPFLWRWQYGKDELQSDQKMDGADMTSPLGKASLPHVYEKTETDGKRIKVYPNSKIKQARIELLNVDVNYFKYYRSLEARNDSDNPVAEPSTLYTNITGGYGCFAAYTAHQIVVPFIE